MRAQREGALDYREYLPGDSGWLLRERLVMASMEQGIIAGQLKAMLPVAAGTAVAKDIISDLVDIETPWLGSGGSGNKEKELAALWEEYEKNNGKRVQTV